MRTNPRGQWSSSCSCGRLPEGKLCPGKTLGSPRVPQSCCPSEGQGVGTRAGHQVPSGVTCHRRVQPQSGFLLEHFLVFPLSQQLLDAPCGAEPAQGSGGPHLVPPLAESWAGLGCACLCVGSIPPVLHPL